MDADSRGVSLVGRIVTYQLSGRVLYEKKCLRGPGGRRRHRELRRLWMMTIPIRHRETTAIACSWPGNEAILDAGRRGRR